MAATCLAASPSRYTGKSHNARRNKDGDPHVVLVGDSLQNATVHQYLQRWPVQQFSGVFVGENSVFDGGSSLFSAFSYPWLQPGAARLPDSPVYADGYTGEAPGATYHVRFNAQAAGPEDNLLSNRIYAMEIPSDQASHFYGGAWANPPAGTKMNADLLVYANPNGQATGLKFDVRGASLTQPLAATPISTYAPSPQVRTYHLSWDAVPWTNGAGLSANVRMEGGTTPAANANLIVLGTRFYAGDADGFQMTNIAWGGKGIDYYLNPSNTSDANLAGFLNGTDSNLAMVWIGTNDAGSLTKEQYKAKVEQLIDRYKVARPGMEFALVSTYNMNNDVMPQYAEALDEVATSDPSVLFLNLNAVAGDYAFLNNTYLFDGVHPTDEGAAYYADKLWGLIDTAAAAPAPEPGSAVLLGGAGVILFRRRRRRRA
jgi:hypothetical protein